jgi:sec-independent protein translocase protein TatA
MGTWSIWHWLIVLAIVALLFGGGGKIPKLMRDVGQGITAFKRGMKDDKDKVEAEATTAAVSPSVTHQDKAAG